MSSELCFYVWLLKRDKMIRDNIGLVPFSHFDIYDKTGETVNIIETNYYEDEDVKLDDMVIKTYIEYKNSLSEFDLAVLERIEKGMRQVDIAKELHTHQKKVSTHKRKMQNELKDMLL